MVTVAVTDEDALLGLIFAIDEADITLVRATCAQNNVIDNRFYGDAPLATATAATNPAPDTGIEASG